VYTRIVSKGAEALGILKEHAYELEVLEALLSQRRWRRGRRGEWYDRRALILTNHVRRWEEARQGLRQGLEDGDTHISKLYPSSHVCECEVTWLALAYRSKLERRLTCLEKKLKIPGEDRYTGASVLVRPGKVLVEGIRVKPKAASVAPDAVVQLNEREVSSDCSFALRRFFLTILDWQIGMGGKRWPRTECGTSRAPGVRTTRLQRVHILSTTLPHTGLLTCWLPIRFHCEGRILTTLFGLLFWDILFAAIPGALETPWQSAPMDIAEDSFYYARRELIEARLAQIEKGGAGAILERTDEEHREMDTWCVGVRWDLFSREELLEIVEVGCLPFACVSITSQHVYYSASEANLFP
jgi:fanconi-associated nuclease 1